MNGDAVGDKIQEIEGQVIVWREMYDFGPLNLSWSKEEQIKRRDSFLKTGWTFQQHYLLKTVKTKIIF